jgi:hypothetical protein
VSSAFLSAGRSALSAERQVLCPFLCKLQWIYSTHNSTTNGQNQTFELIIFVVLLLGINGLVRLCVALNITSLASMFYHNIHLAVKLIRKIIWQLLMHLCPLLSTGKKWAKIKSSLPARAIPPLILSTEFSGGLTAMKLTINGCSGLLTESPISRRF